MLISRIFPFGLLKYHHRSILSYSLCFVSNTSHASSSSKSNTDNLNSDDRKQQSISPIDNNNNEWLWSYLRDRKTFVDLSEDQRRKVIEIGSNYFI
jgi:hypothetical protein